MTTDPNQPVDGVDVPADGTPDIGSEPSPEATRMTGAVEGALATNRSMGEAVEPDDDGAQWRDTFRRITSGGWIVSLGALLLAVIAGSVLIIATDPEVQAAAGYFFARPMDTISAALDAVGRAYAALFRGAIWDFGAPTLDRAMRPFLTTLDRATPLIVAGLGIALSFRSGLFNIGGQGQMLVAAMAGGAVAIYGQMPFPLHMIVALAVGMLAAALWSGIAGMLRAYTGAHEVISTIMLNWTAFYLLSYAVSTKGLLQAPGGFNPKTAPTQASAILPTLVPGTRLHLGFLLALVAVAVMWWILNRSKAGLHFRAVGLNPIAANAAGINVKRTIVSAMLVAGAFVGMAGAFQVQGSITTGFGVGVDSGIGFDALTVALLGRSTPVGTLFAAILFGAFKAGGSTMQAAEGVPIEIVQVVQALIVLFIAAPSLIRKVFHLPTPGVARQTRRQVKEVAA